MTTTASPTSARSNTGAPVIGAGVTRVDGPGKVFDFTNVSGMTIDNIWVELMVVMFWAANLDNSVVRNSRIRNTFADAINMTNGSAGNRITNNAARGTGDRREARGAPAGRAGHPHRGAGPGRPHAPRPPHPARDRLTAPPASPGPPAGRRRPPRTSVVKAQAA